MTFLVNAACGHSMLTEVELMLQYPTDVHQVRCPTCRALKDADTFSVATAWNEVTSVQRVNERLEQAMRNVPVELPSILSDDIMRLQPSVPPNRRNLKRYVTKPRHRAGGKR